MKRWPLSASNNKVNMGKSPHQEQTLDAYYEYTYIVDVLRTWGDTTKLNHHWNRCFQ